MKTNGKVAIKEKKYKAHFFIKNRIETDNMGERLDCKVSIRIPITRKQIIDVYLGDSVFLNAEEWRVTKVSVIREGCNPHYHLIGVK